MTGWASSYVKPRRLRAGDRVAVVQGAFGRISALLVGRARGYTDEQKRALDEAVVATVVDHFGAAHLPIVTNMDFGHTDPQWILPLGVRAELDCAARTFRLTEPAVA